MISLQPISLWERTKEFWLPALKLRREQELKAAIDQLLADPTLDCAIGTTYIPDGFGKIVEK